MDSRLGQMLGLTLIIFNDVTILIIKLLTQHCLDLDE